MSGNSDASYRPEVCEINGAALDEIEVEGSDESEWHGMFELPDMPYLWEPADSDEVISQFRDAVQKKLGSSVDAYMLMQLQHETFSGISAFEGEAHNSTLVMEGKVGVIESMRCLDAMIWKWQSARYPMLEHPTEFGAFVLRGNQQIRVYLSSADLVGQRINEAVVQRIRTDTNEGFELIAHLHNHPFLFDRKPGDRMWTIEVTRNDIAGALAPSMTDVQFYRMFHESFGLKEAWITNGFDTARFTHSEFYILTTHGENID